MKAELVYQAICERIRSEWKFEEREFQIGKSSVFASNNPSVSPTRDIRPKTALSLPKEQKSAGKTALSPLFNRLHKCKSAVSSVSTPLSTDLLSLSTPQPSAPVPPPLPDLFSHLIPSIPSPKEPPTLFLPEIKPILPVSQTGIEAISPISAAESGLDMKTLILGLDSLKTEVEMRRAANRKKEIVINL